MVEGLANARVGGLVSGLCHSLGEMGVLILGLDRGFGFGFVLIFGCAAMR